MRRAIHRKDWENLAKEAAAGPGSMASMRDSFASIGARSSRHRDESVEESDDVTAKLKLRHNFRTTDYQW